LNYDIIIVQNGSISNLSITTVQKSSIHVSALLQSSENIGYARGNNLGIKKALKQEADYILLLNDDTIVPPNFLGFLVEEGEKSSSVGMLGPKIYYTSEPKKIWFAGARFDSRTCAVSTIGFDQGDQREDSLPVESDYISGCALLIKREAIERIGLLDERFFLYWEDVDWCLRAQKAEFKNIVVPSAKIWHKVSVSTGGMDSVIRAYHKTRSHLLFAKLHTPWTLNKLHWSFSRDIAWLLFKSSDHDRVKKAHAYLAAIKDYHVRRIDKGPNWIWKSK
jgi:GT2 family glycosyltransferase